VTLEDFLADCGNELGVQVERLVKKDKVSYATLTKNLLDLVGNILWTAITDSFLVKVELRAKIATEWAAAGR